PLTLDRPPWAAPAFGIEGTLGPVPNAEVAPPGQHGHAATTGRSGATPPLRYRPLPVTPSAEVDLALMLPDWVAGAEVERVLRTSAGPLLERVAILDEYRGESVPARHRSLLWRLTFRDPSRTLRDKEIEGRRQKILRSLENELGVRPRTA